MINYGKYYPKDGSDYKSLAYRFNYYKNFNWFYTVNDFSLLWDRLSIQRLVSFDMKEHYTNLLHDKSSFINFVELLNMPWGIDYILLLFNKSVYNLN